VTLIRDKIRGRLEGGPSELRRAFQFFDVDGSGSIDHDELRKGLRLYVCTRMFSFHSASSSVLSHFVEYGWRRLDARRRTNLEFSDELVSEIMARFDGGSGEIDFNKFAKLVMDSSKDDR
jgi:Ca2+-binding EF-hand superfamily protein